MADDTRDTAAGPRYLTVTEAAAELRISEGRIYDLIYSGQLRHANFGSGRRKLIRVRRADLDAYIEESETR